MKTPDPSAPIASNQPGYFEILEGAGDSGWYFRCRCPCGCQYPDIVPLQRMGDSPNRSGVYWVWDGNLSHPTITPSFRRHTPCRVHFSLTRGIYEIHPDGAPGAPNLYQAPP
jgi:hypothetical protein